MNLHTPFCWPDSPSLSGQRGAENGFRTAVVCSTLAYHQYQGPIVSGKHHEKGGTEMPYPTPATLTMVELAEGANDAIKVALDKLYALDKERKRLRYFVDNMVDPNLSEWERRPATVTHAH